MFKVVHVMLNKLDIFTVLPKLGKEMAVLLGW